MSNQDNCPFQKDDRVSWKGRHGTVVYVCLLSRNQWMVFVHYDDMLTGHSYAHSQAEATELKREPNAPPCNITVQPCGARRIAFYDGDHFSSWPVCPYVKPNCIPPAKPGEWRDYPDGPGWWTRNNLPLEGPLPKDVVAVWERPRCWSRPDTEQFRPGDLHNRWLRLPDAPPR